MRFVRLTACLLFFTVLLSCLSGSLAMPASESEISLQVTEPSIAPTTEPTTAPTELPTEPPTEAPTEVSPEIPPTEIPTETPIEPPTEPVVTQTVYIGPDIAGISAQKAFVYDFSSNSYLYQKSELDAKLYPASITKLMNVYTALKILDLDAVLTVDADTLGIVPNDTSLADLCAGDRLTVHNVILGTLVPSGSDAAHVLSVSAGRVLAGDPELPAREAENLFVEQMNQNAAAMGLVNTHFVNCDGYPHENHYTCMADLVTIAAHCLNTPVIRDTVRNYKVKLTFANGQTRNLYSTNLLLRRSSSYYRKEAVGMKTGTTDAAGACLLSAYWVNGRYMLIGVFQCPTFYSRYNCTVKLFDHFKKTPPTVYIEPPEEPTEAPTIEPGVKPPLGPTQEIPPITQ